MTKILLVEDDKSLREIYGVRLLAEGYDIVSAGDGEEALAMAIKEKPQLIVSDVMMPKISGFDMLDILRSTTETKDIKVIMMTALSSDDQRARGEQLGADRYLVKSQVGIEDVVRTVHEVLADAPMQGGAQPVAPAPPTAPAAPPPLPMPAAPQPQPTPVVVAPTPAPEPAPVAPPPATAPLPQPTAPFSTARPSNLGDRIIHPLEKPESDEPDIGDRMSKELSDHAASIPATPAAPLMPPAPAPPSFSLPATPVAPPVAAPLSVAPPAAPPDSDDTAVTPPSTTPPVIPPPFGQ